MRLDTSVFFVCMSDRRLFVFWTPVLMVERRSMFIFMSGIFMSGILTEGILENADDVVESLSSFIVMCCTGMLYDICCVSFCLITGDSR